MADITYPAKVTVATVATGDPGRLYLRSSQQAGITTNVIGSVAHGGAITALSAPANGWTAVEVSGNDNASRVGEPGGSADGSWPQGTQGYMASAYLKALDTNGDPTLLSAIIPPGANLGGAPPPTIANTPGPVVHPETGEPVIQVKPPAALIKDKRVMYTLLAVGLGVAAVAGLSKIMEHKK